MFECGDKKWKVVQCSLDHCIFMVQEVLSAENDEPEQLGSPQAYLGVHVDDDDALLIGKKQLCEE